MNEPTMRYSRYARSYAARSRIRVDPASRRSGSSGIRAERALAKRAHGMRTPHIGKLLFIIAVILTFAAASCSSAASIEKISSTLSASGKQNATATSGTGSAPTSTPQQEWKKGNMPSLYQIDPQWAANPYAQSTIAESGCGPTCLSMVYVHQTGKKDMDPVKMAAYAERTGYVDAGATSWRFMTEGAHALGLRATELPADKETVKQKLSAGHPIIVVVGPGDFTTTGHYIVLCGIDGSGNAIIRDPNSEENTKRPWDIDKVLSQARNLWAYL